MHRHVFNADFYMTAAALIPLLYIALSLQGTTYSQIIGHWEKARKELAEALSAPLDDDSADSLLLRSVLKSAALNSVASTIWYAGIVGEALAVWALYEQSANSFMNWFVLISIFALLSVPAVTTWWPAARMKKKLWLGENDSFWRKDKKEEP